MSKRAPIFVFQKHIKVSMSQLRQSSVHQNCIKNGHRNDIEFLVMETTLNKLRRNDANFSSIEITSK